MADQLDPAGLDHLPTSDPAALLPVTMPDSPRQSHSSIEQWRSGLVQRYREVVDSDSMVLREFQFRHQFQRCVLRRDDYGYDYDDDHVRGRGRDDAHVRDDDVRALLALRYIARNRSRRGGIRDNYIHSRMYIRRRLFRSSIRQSNRQSGSKRNIHGGYALHSARLLTPKS